MDKLQNGSFRKSILHTRAICAILTILLTVCVLLGLMLHFIWPKEARIYSKTTSYKAPDSELTLEVREWVENEPDGFPGWDFVLIFPDKEERLLERTHAMAGAVITQVDWHGKAVIVYTRAPMGTLILEWD